MSFKKIVLMLSFVFMGFLLGAALSFAIDWLFSNSASIILYVPVLTFPPWFTAGIAGSLLSVAIAFILPSIIRNSN